MISRPQRTSFRHQRPAPRTAPGAPPQISDTVTWSRVVEPREKYRILYRDRDGVTSERVVELMKMGSSQGIAYVGVNHAGRFKTLRVDRVVEVLQQLTTGHEPSLVAQPSYAKSLPPFPVAGAVYKVPTTAASNRTWTVDLNLYTCTCPEKRQRAGMGYEPGQLGFVCDHIAKAILNHLPPAACWSPALLAFLSNPRNVSLTNLT